MEQNNLQTTQGVMTFWDIIRMFKGKIKKMIVVALVALIVGGAIGAAYSLMNREYVATVEFQSTPYDSSTSLLHTLQSEAFAEKLFLEDNGLPPRDECDPVAYDEALEAIEKYETARIRKKAASRAVDSASYDLNIGEIDSEYSYLVSEYNRLDSLLTTYKLAYSDIVASDENHQKMISDLEKQLNVANLAKKKYEDEVYRPARAKLWEYEKEYGEATLELNQARIDAEEKTEAVLSIWRRDNEEIEKLVNAFSGCVTFTYTQLDMQQNTTSNEAKKDENRGFITATVKVTRDEELCNLIVEKLKDRLPGFVVRAVEESSGSVDVRCYSVSPYVEAKTSQPIQTIISVGSIAAVICVLTLVAYCAGVIFSNYVKMNKLNVSVDSKDGEENKN